MYTCRCAFLQATPKALLNGTLNYIFVTKVSIVGATFGASLPQSLRSCVQGVGQPLLAGHQHFPSQAVHPDPLRRVSKWELLGVQQ